MCDFSIFLGFFFSIFRKFELIHNPEIFSYILGIPHTGLKKEALNIILSLSSRLIEKRATHQLALLKKTFGEILITLQRDHAPEIKIRLKDIEDKLKAV